MQAQYQVLWLIPLFELMQNNTALSHFFDSLRSQPIKCDEFSHDVKRKVIKALSFSVENLNITEEIAYELLKKNDLPFLTEILNDNACLLTIEPLARYHFDIYHSEYVAVLKNFFQPKCYPIIMKIFESGVEISSDLTSLSNNIISCVLDNESLVEQYLFMLGKTNVRLLSLEYIQQSLQRLDSKRLE